MAAPEKSPDQGNSSPVPRAFVYIELATDLSSKRKKEATDRQTDRQSVQQSWTERDLGWVAAVRIYGYRSVLRTSTGLFY